MKRILPGKQLIPVILAVGVVAVVYQVFAVWLRVPLPLGWWVS